LEVNVNFLHVLQVTEQAKGVVFKFFAALDQRDHVAASTLIAPDGKWQRQGIWLIGQEAVFNALEARPAERSTCHVISNIEVLAASTTEVELRYYLSAYEAVRDDAGVVSPIRLIAILQSHDKLNLYGERWQITSKTSRRHLPPSMT